MSNPMEPRKARRIGITWIIATFTQHMQLSTRFESSIWVIIMNHFRRYYISGIRWPSNRFPSYAWPDGHTLNSSYINILKGLSSRLLKCLKIDVNAALKESFQFKTKRLKNSQTSSILLKIIKFYETSLFQ